MSSGGGGRAAAALLGLLALAAAVWVHRIEIDRPSSHAELLQADAYRYYYPTAVFLHHELRDGRIPLWNPYQLAGQPYLALHVPAVLYPPGLLLLAILPPLPALAAHAVLHLFLAGLFTWLFAGRLGLSPPARLAAAAAFLLSRPLQLGFYMTPFLSTPVWLPALFWCIHGLASEARTRWAIALGGFLALAFLGGHAQAFVYEAQLAALYGAFAIARVAHAGRRARVAGLALVAGAIAFGLAAPQILPSLELTARAVRGFEGVPYAEAALATIEPAGLAQAAFRFARAERPGPHASLAMLPVLALPLALAGLLARRQRGHQLFFLVALGGVGLLMLGARTPAFGLYYALPLGNLFRLPSRMAFAWSFLAAMAVGIGIEAVRERCAARGPRWLPGAAAAALALGVGADLYALTRTANAHPAVTGDFLGGPSGLIELLRSDPERPRVFVETTGLYSTDALDKLGMMNGVFAVPDYEPSMPRAYLDYFRPAAPGPWHGRLHVVDAANPGRGLHRADPRRLDLLGVRYVMLESASPPLERALRKLTGSPGRWVSGALLYERPDAVPRAYAVRRVRAVPDLAAALAESAAAGFRPLEEAVVTAPGAAGAPSAEPGPPGADRVSIAGYAPHRVALHAECAERCLAVLTDLDYPGWRAEVDGRPAPILATNAIFRGVWLEPGRHEVVFHFAPASFRVGLAILAATLVALAAAALRARAGSRRGS
jgi:hypothetical protein